MMTRRTFLRGLTLGTLSAPLAIEAQQAAKVYRIGFLSLLHGPGPFEEVFRQALRELGWIEGRNVAFEYRWAAGQLDRLPALAEGLVRSNVDLIVTSTMRVDRICRHRHDDRDRYGIVRALCDDPYEAPRT